MHAMVRAYKGQAGKDLYDLLVEKKADVTSRMNEVGGLISYNVARTDDGCVAIIVCRDKLGCDQSLSIAKDWLADNAQHLGLAPPVIVEGPVGIHLPV